MMGFFDSLAKTIGYSAFDIYNDEEANNYRERGLENKEFNNSMRPKPTTKSYISSLIRRTHFP